MADPPLRVVVGNATENTKEAIKEAYQKRFYGEDVNVPGVYHDDVFDEFKTPGERLKEIQSMEMEKKSYEIELIKRADEELNEIMEKLGVKSFSVPTENVHIVDNKLHQEKTGKRTAGFCDAKERFVVIPDDRRQDPIDLISVIFHELNHLKGYKALKVDTVERVVREKTDSKDDLGLLQILKEVIGFARGNIEKPEVKTKPETVIDLYRSGLTAGRIKKPGEEREKDATFVGLEEAVVAEMELRFRKKISEEPIVKNLYREFGEKSKSIFWDDAGYPFHREVLNALTSGIYEKNKDKFGSEDEVFDVFAKARFTGELLPMCRLIKNTFGRDIFEKVVAMSRAVWEATEISEMLKTVTA